MPTANPLSDSVYKRRTLPTEYGIRGDYFRDQTAIIHSMPFRRLKHKTQVFFDPENDHVCTRIEHVLHVATIAATICKGLNKHGWKLDGELAYAIGLGHDLGHAPFGHAGESTLNDLMKKEGGFIHEVNGYRVVEYLANNGKGLNLTYAVKDGILCHNGEQFERSLRPAHAENNLERIKERKSISSSYEGCIVRFSDKIAYLGRDIEDALLADLISPEDIPNEIRESLGTRNGEIIDTLVEDIIESSKDSDEICFSTGRFELVSKLKEFNYKSIYKHARLAEYGEFSARIIKSLFDYLQELYSDFGQDFEAYRKRPNNYDTLFGRYLEKTDEFYHKSGRHPKRIICDYISGMTDGFALEWMKGITIPKPIIFNHGTSKHN